MALTDDLLGYWAMNSDNVSDNLIDAVNGLTFVSRNTPPTVTFAGLPFSDYCLRCSAGSGLGAYLPYTSEWSLSWWSKPYTLMITSGFVGRFALNGITSNRAYLGSQGSSTTLRASSKLRAGSYNFNYNLSGWQHYYIAYSSGKLYIYINNVYRGVNNGGATDAPLTYIEINRVSHASLSQHDLEITNLAAWDRLLTNEEISEVYNNGNGMIIELSQNNTKNSLFFGA